MMGLTGEARVRREKKGNKEGDGLSYGAAMLQFGKKKSLKKDCLALFGRSRFRDGRNLSRVHG